MIDVPDWLWHGLIEDAIWAGLAFGVGYAWKYRKAIAARLGKAPEDIVIQLQPLSLKAQSQPAIVTAEATLYATGKLDATGKVEAPTPSLARRLEELAAWYLHVS